MGGAQTRHILRKPLLWGHGSPDPILVFTPTLQVGMPRLRGLVTSPVHSRGTVEGFELQWSCPQPCTHSGTNHRWSVTFIKVKISIIIFLI